MLRRFLFKINPEKSITFKKNIKQYNCDIDIYVLIYIKIEKLF